MREKNHNCWEIGIFSVLLADDFFFFFGKEGTVENCVNFCFVLSQNHISLHRFGVGWTLDVTIVSCFFLAQSVTLWLWKKNKCALSLSKIVTVSFCQCIWWKTGQRKSLQGADVLEACAKYSFQVGCYTKMCIIRHSASHRVTVEIPSSTGRLLTVPLLNWSAQCLVSVTNSHGQDFARDLSCLISLGGWYHKMCTSFWNREKSVS